MPGASSPPRPRGAPCKMHWPLRHSMHRLRHRAYDGNDRRHGVRTTIRAHEASSLVRERCLVHYRYIATRYITMQRRRMSALIGLVAFAGRGCLLPLTPTSAASEVDMRTNKVAIPQSVQAEHAAIHATLVEAPHAPGRVGVTARELAHVLHPHIVREEEIALPPLGLLAPHTTNNALPAEVLAEALTMSDTLRAELPRMLQEHTRIRVVVEALRHAAHVDGAPKYVQLAEHFAMHPS